jgi:hypothetical protein
MNRNEFIRTSGRLVILGLIGVFTGGMIYRQRITLKKSCGLNVPCSHCRYVATCNLPEAVNDRENEKEENV